MDLRNSVFFVNEVQRTEDTEGGVPPFDHFFFAVASVSLARVTPLFLRGHSVSFVSTAFIFRYESSMRWLATLRQTNRATCFGH